MLRGGTKLSPRKGAHPADARLCALGEAWRRDVFCALVSLSRDGLQGKLLPAFPSSQRVPSVNSGKFHVSSPKIQLRFSQGEEPPGTR